MATGIDALKDAALTMVAWNPFCGPDFLQQSAAVSFIGQCSRPALQQAICAVTVAVGPSTQAAPADVRTPATTSNEASARILRTIPCIVCPGIRSVKLGAQNFTSTLHRA